MRQPLIVVCGPTAVGKTAVMRRVLKKLPELQTGITYTTRAKRTIGKEDKIMHYISVSEFKQKISDKFFLEWSIFNHDYYGTARQTLEKNSSKPLLLNIDIGGAMQIKKRFPWSHLIFIKPESIRQIEQRLIKRGLSGEALHGRLQEAKAAMAKAHLFDQRIINHQGRLPATVVAIVSSIKAYIGRLQAIDKKVKNL